MNIILLRHLDTMYSCEHLICGQTDCGILPGKKLIIPDEITGIMNAGKIKIYSSPLKRCLETTRLLADTANCHNIALVPEFVERDWGPLTGLAKVQVLQQYGTTISSLRNTLEGVESDADFSARIHRGIEQLALSDVSTVFIVTHQGCLRIICEFFGSECKKFKPGEFALIEIEKEIET